jgi:hypothetical protein
MGNSGNVSLENVSDLIRWPAVPEWSFLTNHARVLLCIAHDPGIRLRDIAHSLHITERTAYGIVTDLTEGGYVLKEKDGRRNRYQIQVHLPLRESIARKQTIGDVLEILVDTNRHRQRSAGADDGTDADADTPERLHSVPDYRPPAENQRRRSSSGQCSQA